MGSMLQVTYEDLLATWKDKLEVELATGQSSHYHSAAPPPRYPPR